MNETRVYCSAGISHCLIYPNADVYRCISDYTTKKPPLFNAKNGWRPLKDVSVCNQDKCDSWCDTDWTTKWIFEKGATMPRVIKAQAKDFSVIGPLIANQDMRNPVRNMAHIVWNPTFVCNYTCVYCGCAVDKPHIYKNYPSTYPELSLEEWLDIWGEVRKNYDFAVITIGGGEPLLSKATLPAIEMLLDKFIISLTSNLSLRVMNIVRSNIKAYSEHIIITASLHPTAKEFNRDLFYGSILCLKNNGFSVRVNFVAHPLQMFLAKEYKEWCDKYGITFIVTPWCGYDNDGFMSKYTEKEMRFIDSIVSRERKANNLPVFRSYRYIIDGLPEKIDIEHGYTFKIIGKIKNIGEISWHNESLKEEECFKVGIKIADYANKTKVLREYRALLPVKNIFPGETCEFKLDIDTRDLDSGFYCLKCDLVKEGEYWFEDRGADPVILRLNVLKFSSTLGITEVILPQKIDTNEIVVAKVKILNSGSKLWDPLEQMEDIKAGCRMYKKDIAEQQAVVREFRSNLDYKIKPGEICGIEMYLDFSGLDRGEYNIVFDLLNEGKFWFVERGGKVNIKDIHLS